MAAGATRLAADIGGTFTDIALETADGRSYTAKVLTTPAAPELGVLDGIREVIDTSGVTPDALDLVIHGTTLATNAIIERKGAKTAMLVTEGFRDAVEMAYENRFEQYDIYMERPAPLVPRELRLGIPERIDARGNVVVPLDEDAVRAAAGPLRDAGIEAVAVGYMHGYADGTHERRTRDILQDLLPDLAITLSSEVSPEMREYERWSTAAANAYVQPLMAAYLARLNEGLKAMEITAPLVLITSGGGLTSLETARRFPIRLVESGPAGGAILAAQVAQELAADRVLSFDMGGTTAKICLIDDGKPQYSRFFEVAREYRFLKGSGLPLRIPVIEMVEIGAGGGSIARVDSLSRIQVGPDSAGADPGPVAYGRGGEAPTVTDADVVLGRIDPGAFAGGDMQLDADGASRAVSADIGTPLDLHAADAAFGVVEIVEENMANAARVHAVELGKDLGDRTMISFGGAAPVHAARLAEKLGIPRVVIPVAAGVGSAIGFLAAPVAYEVVRSRYTRLDETFDGQALESLFAEMREEAEAIVREAAPDGDLEETRTADMRYVGQGHEITVPVRAGPIGTDTRDALRMAFEEGYRANFGRTIPGLEVEILNWTLRLATRTAVVTRPADVPESPFPETARSQQIYDPETRKHAAVPQYRREALSPGMHTSGPAVIAENQTTTIVPAAFDVRIDATGAIVLERRT